MPKKMNGVPANYHTVTPYLCLDGVVNAIEFYQNAFDAREGTERVTDPETGRIGYAQVWIGDSLIMLSDEHKEYDVLSPQTFGGSPLTIVLYVEDVDKTFDQAIAAGAKSINPVKKEFYGDRAGKLEDPFGYRWLIQTHVEDVSAETMQQRGEESYEDAKSS